MSEDKTASEENLVTTLQNEVQRLKHLMNLQLSLISRQQDLLKIRDKEVMQLKARSQSYKCQLERIRRRVSLSKKTDIEADNSFFEAENDRNLFKDFMKDEEIKKETKPIPETSLKDKPEISSKASQITLQDFHTPTKEDPNKVPVPVSFIKQQQRDLINALLLSPDNKLPKTVTEALNTACSNISTRNYGESVFKICDSCPQCVAAAAEIIQLISLAASTDVKEIKEKAKRTQEEKEIMRMVGIKPNAEPEKDEPKESLLQTSILYHRDPPPMMEKHWWFQTNWNCVKTGDPLNIPTWRKIDATVVTTSTSNDSINSTEVENTDDSEYFKRHQKLEINEKKRKKWDIQRIREYRYTEKLRQKALKQDAHFSPTFDSFAGNLMDADSIHVANELPVNIFGYPLPHIEPEEFSLASMRNNPKLPGQSKKKRKL